ncbi:MAG: hypothetical protein RBT75_18325 [Anaerolineae bacterium]|nr:hypothetical protein [Anaerolineae bacterium]
MAKPAPMPIPKEVALAAAVKRMRKITPLRILEKAFRLWEAQQVAEVKAHAERILERVSTERLLKLNPKMPQLLFRAGIGRDWYIPGTTEEIRHFVAVSLARLRRQNQLRRRAELLGFNMTLQDAEAYYMALIREEINVTSGMHVVNEEGGVLTIAVDLGVEEDGSVPYEAEVKLRLDGENLILDDGYSGNTITRWPVSNPQQVVRYLEDMVAETDRLLKSASPTPLSPHSIESSLPALI